MTLKEKIAAFINNHKWLLAVFIGCFVVGTVGLLLAGFTKEALDGTIVAVGVVITGIFGLASIIAAFFKK